MNNPILEFTRLSFDRFGSAVLFSAFMGSAVAASQQTGMVPLRMSVPSVVQRSTAQGPTDPNQVIHISINLSPSNSAGLQAFADSVSDPKSASYQHFITPVQVGQMFGQPEPMVRNIVTYIESKGFTVKLVANDRIGILADCTVAQAEAAFNVTINNYRALKSNEPSRANYYCFAEPPQLPASIASSVLYVEGLQNFTLPHPMANPLTPGQTRTLYNSAPLFNGGMQGQGRHVAISNWDGFRLSNVPLYYKQFSLPTPAGGVGSNISVVTVDGGSGAGVARGEGDVDIQMVLGMAPLADFIIYDGGGLLTDVLTQEANDNLADIVSESYGWSLDGAAEYTASHNIHLVMTAQGMTYMAAAGDSGTGFEPFSYPNVEPEVLSVGGTVATFDSLGNRISEPSWSNGGGGWGSDPAPFNILPSWQKGKGVPTDINFRLIPDVAFNAAGPNGGGAYQFYFNGALDFDLDGTSFASPAFAGMLTVAEQEIISLGGLTTAPHRFGRIQDLIYSQNGRADVWYDVTEGSNGVLPNGELSVAGPGWDFASGWGCMNIAGFVNSVAATPPIVFAPNSASVFDNTFASPSIAEGNYVAGTPASLAGVDENCYTVGPVVDGSLGKIASVKATYATSLTPGSTASLNVMFTGYVPAGATVMIYIYNWNTNAYDLLKTLSGTQAGAANTVSISTGSASNYINSKGVIQVVARSLVPADRATTVGPYKFEVDQLVVSGSAKI